MSKINAVRIVNLNYNNNAIKVSDEVFTMDGDSTLLSLRNGGGKSVLVQMITAPFVHKKYRNTRVRPFESYFTTNKPTFLMVEWKLDGQAGYVLTGMMVRRRQNTGEEGEAEEEKLEIYNFISEYRERCSHDIYNIPVVEKNPKEMILKNFAACLKLFESYKKNRSCNFQYYDMTNYAQSRAYFDKLLEYQINSREWESIIYEVNKKESGLSELFSDCRDEKGLVEKWFLKAVGDKLDREKDRMKEFQDIVEKYAGQYKDNRSKIEKRDTMKAFKEEAKAVEERAEDCQRADEEQQERENAIANFFWLLQQLERETAVRKNETAGQLQELEKELQAVRYEKLSFEFYALKEEESFHIGNRDMIGLERDELEREKEQAARSLHCLLCAGQQTEVDELRGEYEECRQRLELSRRKEEDTEPERRQTGSRLRQHFDGALQVCRRKRQEKEEDCRSCQEKIEELSAHADGLTGKLMAKQGEIGHIRARLEGYDEKENEYNRRFGENLARNILGTYEPAELDIRGRRLEQAIEEQEKENKKQEKELERQKEAKLYLERELEAFWQRAQELQLERSTLEQLIEGFEQELRERRIILEYFELTESSLFDKEQILEQAERKLQEVEQARTVLEREAYELQKEYSQLSRGKVLELPEEFDELLKSLGLHPVYGMDWLKKNGNSAQENQQLVENCPFLPYALILTEQEFARLKQSKESVYTSFPIPILLRGQLEERREPGGSLHSFAGVSFYVLFNSMLLDEEKLAEVLKEKEQQLKKKQEQLSRRKQEFRDYCEKKDIIQRQSVNQKDYEKQQKSLAEVQKDIEENRTNVLYTKEKLADSQKQIQRLEKALQKTGEELRVQEEKKAAFSMLCQSYEEYMQRKQEFGQAEKDAEALEQQRRLALEEGRRLQAQLKSLEHERTAFTQEEDGLQEKCRRYRLFSIEEETPGLLQPEELQALEARFHVLTKQISDERQELERQWKQADKRLQRAEQKLQELAGKYGLSEEEWRAVSYHKEEEQHQEALYEELRKKITGKNAQWNEADKRVLLLGQKAAAKSAELRERCGESKPVPKEHMKEKDFDGIMNRLLFQKEQKETEEQSLQERINIYSSALLALSEYEELEIQRKLHYEDDFHEKPAEELRRMQGMLLRDYKKSRERVRDCQDALERTIRELLMQERFQEEDYQKPLEIMLELGSAGLVLEQLHTILTSYDMLMEKLEIDISLLEREKAHIAGLLEEYVQAVHDQLGRIDGHSTINVRDRRIKMLILSLPDWEENEELYRVRVQDFIDEIVAKGLEYFENNENPGNYFSSRLTTRNLYDVIIGIHNVQVRLYKIEEYREYPISWADVARNSGGEGFLSAFIVLASLLYYMRRDDTDLFADKNEGKVLIMDNPFAQTNAAHLLKPMMDMARQTNTQLICLSGLGGESIYNCFDNIYVLNLADASLQSGLQYLRGERLRGAEAETMVSSHIQVGEQLGLEF